MEVKLDVGASVDIATSGEIADEMERRLDQRDKRRVRPIYASYPAQVIMGAAETFVDCGSPNVGRMWNVVGLTLFGSDDSTSVANAKAALYFGDSDTPSIVGLKVPGLVVPSFTSFTKSVLWCHPQEDVVIGFSGAAQGVTLNAIAHIIDYDEKDVTAWSTK